MPYIDTDNLKPVIYDLIEFYYDIDGNEAGGYLHIVLDDGNCDDGYVWDCQKTCADNKDWLGLLIAHTLRSFTEEERDEMYERDWLRPPKH